MSGGAGRTHALRCGALLLGLAPIPHPGTQEAAAATLAAVFYRVLSGGESWTFDELMGDERDPVARRRAARVLRRLKKRGFLRYEHWWDRWVSVRADRRRAQRWAILEAARRDELRVLVRERFHGILETLYDEPMFRDWLLDAVRGVLCRDLRLPEMIRFIDLVERRTRDSRGGADV